MTSLAERVERAVEGSRELDAEIAEIALLPFCEEPDCLPDVLVRIISRVKAGGEDCETRLSP